MKKQKIISFTLLLFTAVVWGAAYPCLDYIIAYGEMSLAMLNLLRFGVGALCFLPFIFSQSKLLTKHDIKIGIVSGIILFFAFLTLTIAIADGSPSISALLINISVLIVPILSSLTDKKLPNKYIVISVILMFIGFVFLVFKDGFVLESGSFDISILFGFISAVLFSVQIFIVGKYHNHSEVSSCMTFIQLSVIVVLFALYIVIFESANMFVITGTKSLLLIACLGVFATGFAYYSQTKASVYLSENTCNIILAMESFFAVIFSIILGIDTLTWFFAIGVIFVIIAVNLNVFSEMKIDNKIKSKTKEIKEKHED